MRLTAEENSPAHPSRQTKTADPSPLHQLLGNLHRLGTRFSAPCFYQSVPSQFPSGYLYTHQHLLKNELKVCTQI